jgi:hypothetical protein
VEEGPTQCVEIVVHARPDPRALPAAVRNLSRVLRLHEGLHYWAATYMRLVVDPDTLTPYLRDARRYWYVRCGEQQLVELQSAHGRSAGALRTRDMGPRSRGCSGCLGTA